MLELVSKRNIIPSSLYMMDVKTEMMPIAIGGFGHVFKGEHKGLVPVALKVVDKGHADVSVFPFNIITPTPHSHLIRTHLKKTFAGKLWHGNHSHTVLSFLS